MTVALPTGLVRCSAPVLCLCQGKRYTCRRCKRFVPFCFGAADDCPEVCDDCAAQIKDGSEDAFLWLEVPESCVR